MAGLPSGKARLCKSLMRRFDSGPRLHLPLPFRLKTPQKTGLAK